MKSLFPRICAVLCLGLAFLPLSSSLAEEQETAAMTKLLQSIPVKDLKYESASLAKVLADLQETAKANLAPDSRIPLLLFHKNPERNLSGGEPVVNLNLKNTSLYEALSILGMLNGLEIKVNSKGVLLTQAEDLAGSW